MTDLMQGSCRLDVEALVAAAAEMRVEAAEWLDVDVDDAGVRGAFSMLELQARELLAADGALGF
jgi:hypothetical protein